MLLGPLGTRIGEILLSTNKEAGFLMSLVCDDSGLLLAVAGEGADEDQLAGLTSLFDDIATRARRDIGLQQVDEVTMFDAEWGRYVIRPLPIHTGGRFFLVVRVPARSTWRRYTNKLKREITKLFTDASEP